MEKNDWHEPIDYEDGYPAEFEQPTRLSDSVLERRRRRFTVRSDGLSPWNNLHGLELPDSPIPTNIAMEEEMGDPIQEAEEIVDEDFLV